MSDLHLEFGPLRLDEVDADVLVLAGDIGVAHSGGMWAIAQAERFNIPVVMVAGNHEFYEGWKGHDMRTVYKNLKQLSEDSENFHFLQNDSVVIDGVRFLGATLWTDFELDHSSYEYAMAQAKQRMNDYRYICRAPMQSFDPIDAKCEHHTSKEFFARSIDEEFNGDTVIISHHGVSRKSIAPEYVHDSTNPAYVSNLDDFVAWTKAKVWFHGHIHASFDYVLGETRVLTNPRGYVRHDVNVNFDPNKIVEI